MQVLKEEVLEAHRWWGPLRAARNGEKSREHLYTVISILGSSSSPQPLASSLSPASSGTQ